MKINTTELIKELTILKNYIAKNDYKPPLQVINASLKDNKLTLEATNSYIAYKTTLEVELEDFDKDFESITFDNVDLKDFKKSEFTSLNFEEGVATTEDRSINLNITDLGRYPDLEKILHVFTKHRFALSVEQLKNMIKGLEKDDVVVFKYDSLKQYAPIGFEVNGKENKKGVIGQVRK